MTIRFLICSFIIILFTCCSYNNESKQISFYHWKSNANFKNSFGKALDDSDSKKIYLHYFDIDKIKAEKHNDHGIYPTYVIKNVSNEFKDYEIIPVIYITNRVLQSEKLNVKNLSNKIVQLINQISIKHFNKKLEKVQIDCDWTQSTRDTYFTLLRSLKSTFQVDVTIRLHQIKFYESTGIPPVETGTLMLYNIGDLKNMEHNSILESKTVTQYINEKTSYPLSLKVALPLFSQTVIKNNNDEIKLINHSVRDKIKNDKHFKQISQNNYQVELDTLFNGFYLSKGYKLKLEETNELDIIQSYKVISKSQLKINGLIFYHLDELILSNMDLEKIINEL